MSCYQIYLNDASRIKKQRLCLARKRYCCVPCKKDKLAALSELPTHITYFIYFELTIKINGSDFLCASHKKSFLLPARITLPCVFPAYMLLLSARWNNSIAYMNNNSWNIMINGDKEAFLEIYHECYRSLFHYGFSLTANRELTKDCIQELFMDVWNTRPVLNKEVSNVQSYLFTWLRRKISRKKLLLNRQEKSYQQSGEENNCNEFCYEELLIAFQQTEEKKEQLTRALTTLTKRQLQIIRLKFFDDLSYDEISEKTSLTTRSIYNIIYEALHRLRESLPVLI